MQRQQLYQVFVQNRGSRNLTPMGPKAPLNFLLPLVEVINKGVALNVVEHSKAIVMKAEHILDDPSPTRFSL